MKTNYILIILVVLVVAGVIFAYSAFQNAGTDYEKKTSQSAVNIVLAPKTFDKGSFSFDINIDTHTVELSQFDLKELATLEINGEEFKPITAPVLNGHHTSGSLVFNIEEKPKIFSVVIKDIPDISLRRFSW